MQRHSSRVLALVLTLLLQGCLPDRASLTAAPAPADSTPTPTAFQPATATPTTVRLWISPAVPDLLRDAVAARLAHPARQVVLVAKAEDADIRLEPGGREGLARWTYAVVAPFPTLRDDVALAEVLDAWRQGSLWAAPDTAAAMEALFGPPQVAPTPIPADELLDRAWAQSARLALVPFEALDPRWKVLAVDGASPLRRAFDDDGYPLKIEFGLSGEAWAVAALKSLLAGLPSVNRDPAHLTVLAMTGVTALTRATAAVMEAQGATYPSALIGDWLRQADLTHVSNEVSFWPQCPAPTLNARGLRFCSLPGHLALLEDIGVDIVELTGNHVLDWGSEAFLYSLGLYRERGWLTFGGGEDLEHARQPALIEHNGNRLAFLGCNPAGPATAWADEARPGAAPCDFEGLSSQIAGLRADGYLPIVTFQWWELGTVMPDRRQAAGFRSAAEAGAVIVSGSQAHNPMGFEFFGGAFIHYGLGNLFFYQSQDLAPRQVLIDRHVFYEGRLIGTEVLTALVENYAQPRPMTPDERAALLSALFRASGWEPISP